MSRSKEHIGLPGYAPGLDAYSYVLAGIVDGAFRPLDRLSLREISLHTGLSQAEIRAAVRELELQKLIELVPHRAPRVAPVDEVRLFQTFGTLFLLCQLAVRETAGTLTPQQLEALGEHLSAPVEGTEDEQRVLFTKQAVRYFTELAAISRNDVLLDSIQRMVPRVIRIVAIDADFMHLSFLRERMAAIHAAMCNGDAASATSVLDEMNTLSKAKLLEIS